MSEPIPSHWVSSIIDSEDTRRPNGYIDCGHKHRTGQAAAVCGARRIRRLTECVNHNPQNLPAVLGYSVVPKWRD